MHRFEWYKELLSAGFLVFRYLYRSIRDCIWYHEKYRKRAKFQKGGRGILRDLSLLLKLKKPIPFPPISSSSFPSFPSFSILFSSLPLPFFSRTTKTHIRLPRNPINRTPPNHFPTNNLHPKPSPTLPPTLPLNLIRYPRLSFHHIRILILCIINIRPPHMSIKPIAIPFR